MLFLNRLPVSATSYLNFHVGVLLFANRSAILTPFPANSAFISWTVSAGFASHSPTLLVSTLRALRFPVTITEQRPSPTSLHLAAEPKPIADWLPFFFVLLFAVMIGRTMGRWGLLPPGYRRSVLSTSPATNIQTAGLVSDRRFCYNYVLKLFQKRLTMPSACVILFVSSKNSRNFSREGCEGAAIYTALDQYTLCSATVAGAKKYNGTNNQAYSKTQ